MAISIPLGSAQDLAALFSYPNKPDGAELLPATIKHWMDQMLCRDGFGPDGATSRVRVVGDQFNLELEGPEAVRQYAERLPVFLEHGRMALGTVAKIKKEKPSTPWPSWVEPPCANRLWDPQSTGQWRYFLPWGMAMLNQKALNFFHYPPIRLLNAMRDYLDDPVPMRLVELMEANGVETVEEAWLFSTVMDGAPVAAPDDQGTIYKGPNDYSDPVHLLPIEKFGDYQRAQVDLLCQTKEKYTIPILVYGTPARAQFGRLYDANKKSVSTKKAVMMTDVVKGKKTAVLGSGHPYAFYAQTQATVGAGSILPEMWPTAIKTMTHDLSVVRWQIEMAADRSQDPQKVFEKCQAHWSADEQALTVHTLVLHQGSLFYPDPNSLQFEFQLTMAGARKRAAAAMPRKWTKNKSKPKSAKVAKSKAAKKKAAKKSKRAAK